MSGKDRGLPRRRVLRSVGGAVAAGTLVGSATTASAQSVNYGGWFGDVSNFDGTVDRRGESEVTVQVGTEANGGFYGFGPAAIRIDPGTTVVWEWTGRGSQHNVVDLDGAYESALSAEEGFTFSHTFESEGISKYYCLPHRALGMKGAVVVGDVTGPTDDGGAFWESPSDAFGTVFLGLIAGLTALGALVVIGAELARGGIALPTRRRETHGPIGPAVESQDKEPVREVDHDSFTPSGTAGLVLLYLAIVVGMWIFMYFIEFLGNGPTVIGG